MSQYYGDKTFTQKSIGRFMLMYCSGRLHKNVQVFSFFVLLELLRTICFTSLFYEQAWEQSKIVIYAKLVHGFWGSVNLKMVSQVGDPTRPTLRQFWSFETCRTTLLNNIWPGIFFFTIHPNWRIWGLKNWLLRKAYFTQLYHGNYDCNFAHLDE